MNVALLAQLLGRNPLAPDMKGTPGINPAAPDPRVSQFPMTPPPNPNVNPATMARKQQENRGSLLSPLLGRLGPIGRGIDRFGQDLASRARESAMSGSLGALAPRFQAGVLQADENRRGNMLADLNKQLIRARIQQMQSPKPTESFDVLSDDEEKSLGLDPTKTYQRSSTSGKISPVDRGPLTVVNTGSSPGASIFDAPTDVRGTFEKRQESARSAQVTHQAAGGALQVLLGSDAPFTGAAAPLKELGARVLDVMANENSTIDEVNQARASLASSEAFDSQTGVLVGQIIKLFGAGTGLSDADREFAKKIAGAMRSGSKQGLERVLRGAVERSSRDIERYNEDLNRLGERFKDANVLYRPLELQEISEPQRSGPPAGITPQEWSVMTPEERALFE